MLGYLMHKRLELSTKYGADHPEMVALDRQIKLLEDELEKSGDRPKKK